MVGRRGEVWRTRAVEALLQRLLRIAEQTAIPGTKRNPSNSGQRVVLSGRPPESLGSALEARRERKPRGRRATREGAQQRRRNALLLVQIVFQTDVNRGSRGTSRGPPPLSIIVCVFGAVAYDYRCCSAVVMAGFSIQYS